MNIKKIKCVSTSRLIGDMIGIQIFTTKGCPKKRQILKQFVGVWMKTRSAKKPNSD